LVVGNIQLLEVGQGLNLGWQGSELVDVNVQALELQALGLFNRQLVQSIIVDVEVRE